MYVSILLKNVINVCFVNIVSSYIYVSLL